MKYPGGRYLVVLNMAEARKVCDYIEGSGSREELEKHFARSVSPGFDFSRDLTRVGIANQTTMLSKESLAIAEEFRLSIERRYGAEHVAEHFRTFDTICSATQERQDAVVELLEKPLDVMVVVGGYNSSNTCHLAALAQSRGVRTYHVEDAQGIDPASASIRHQPVGKKTELVQAGWLENATRIGITAGASTPNNKIGETISRISATAGVESELQKWIGG
jgi:4-hydroxy-3-methylbut-2-enyl diphosphate reductase